MPRPTDAEADAKAERAFLLAMCGIPYTQIAKALGYYDASGASKAIERHARYLPRHSKRLATLKVQHLADHAGLYLLAAAAGGDAKAAADLLKVAEHYRKLYALDPPAQTDPNAAEGSRDRLLVVLPDAVQRALRGDPEPELAEDGTNVDA